MAVDDRKKTKSRFSLFLVLSLIVHTGAVIILYWSPIRFERVIPVDPKKKTVVINMAPEKKEEKKEEEKKEDKKEEKKKEEEKKQQQKEQQKQQKQQEKQKQEQQKQKQEQQKQEQQKQEQQKQEQQKQEQQKQEQQKQEQQKQQQSQDAAAGKSSESNKSAPSRSAKTADGKDQPKKGEPGKGKPAKSEPAKGHPSKGEPSKGQPSKGEPAKGEPKKGEQTKQQAKSAPDKKAPTKQQETKKSRRDENPEFGLDYNNYQQPGMDMPDSDNKNPGVQGEDPNNLAYWTKRLGNVKQLNESAMQRSIVVTEGASDALDRRQQQGMAELQTLTPQQKQEFNRVLNDNVGNILKNYVKPQKDGKKYYGEIRFTVDKQGFIDQANFKVRSGNDQLDQAMLDALISTRKLDLSADAYVSRVVTMFPMVLNYSDEDME